MSAVCRLRILVLSKRFAKCDFQCSASLDGPQAEQSASLGLVDFILLTFHRQVNLFEQKWKVKTRKREKGCLERTEVMIQAQTLLISITGVFDSRDHY